MYNCGQVLSYRLTQPPRRNAWAHTQLYFAIHNGLQILVHKPRLELHVVGSGAGSKSSQALPNLHIVVDGSVGANSIQAVPL